MASNDIEVVPCAPPDGVRHANDSVWWKAVVGGQEVAHIGAYNWELDNALCLYQDPMEAVPFFEVTTELIETVLRYSKMAGYGGVYAITYKKDQVLPVVLDALNFARIETGRAWSENPTIYWFREGL